MFLPPVPRRSLAARRRLLFVFGVAVLLFLAISGCTQSWRYLRTTVGSTFLFPFFANPTVRLTQLSKVLREARLLLRSRNGDIAHLRLLLQDELHKLKQEVALIDRDLARGMFEPSSNGSWFQRMSKPSEDAEIRVPFYMYDSPEFAKFEQLCKFETEGTLGAGGHMGEYWMHQHLKEHRWRTTAPEDAIIFVVPVYLGAALEGLCGGEQAGRELILEATHRLQNEPWFQRNSGNDHLFVGTHYKIFWWFRDTDKDPALVTWTNMMWARFLSAFEESFCPILAPYSTLRAFESRSDLVEISRTATIDEYLQQRPNSFFFVGRAFFEHHRGGYETRRAMLAGIQGYRSPNVIVTTLAPDDSGVPYCNPDGPYEGCVYQHSETFYVDHAFKAKFHLMIRGDDWSSSRLFDAVHAGALVIAISDGIYDKVLPFGCMVDWDSILIRVPEMEFRKNATAALDRYVPDWNTPEGRHDLQRRLSALQAAQRDLVWTLPDSRVAENILLTAARRCLPEAFLLRRPPSPQATLRSLSELSCPYRDVAKGRYVPGRHGVGAFQEGWNQDD